MKEALAREDAHLEQQVGAADEATKSQSLPAPSTSQEANSDPVVVVPETPIDHTMSVDEMQSEPKQMSWEEMLEENDVHDVVNNDSDMYDTIEGTPMDSEDLADQVIAVVQNHVSEVRSPPRVTRLASQIGLSAGFAYDLMTNDETGAPWDFHQQNLRERERCMRHVPEQKPQFLSGSPMCIKFSALQWLNKWHTDPKKWDALLEKGLRHMNFAIKLYRIQAQQGRWFLHEHPNSASS